MCQYSQGCSKQVRCLPYSLSKALPLWPFFGMSFHQNQIPPEQLGDTEQTRLFLSMRRGRHCQTACNLPNFYLEYIRILW